MSGVTESISSISEVRTEVKLQKFYEEEEGDMIVMEFCEDLVNNVMEQIQADTLTDQAQDFAVRCAIQAIKKAVEMNYCYHNVSFSDMGKESWEPDVPCEPAKPDNWAAYRVPITFDKESEEKTTEQLKEMKPIEEKQSKNNIHSEVNAQKVSISPSSSSQDILSIMDYLEDILSTSSDEELNTSWMNIIDLDRLSHHSSSFSAKLSAKLSHFIGKSSLPENVLQPRLSDQEKALATGISKTAMGDMEKGLCIPHVGNLPVSNVVKEVPEVEEFTLIKVEKRKTKVTKKGASNNNNLPRRRSDTKLKMAPLLEEPVRDKSKDKRK